MSHFKIILETNPMICLCNKYPYQNTLEYKTNKRVGFQNNFKMRHESLGLCTIYNKSCTTFMRVYYFRI